MECGGQIELIAGMVHLVRGSNLEQPSERELKNEQSISIYGKYVLSTISKVPPKNGDADMYQKHETDQIQGLALGQAEELKQQKGGFKHELGEIR